MKRTLIVLMLLAVITACKKKEDPVPAPAPPASPGPTVDPHTYSADIDKTQKVNFVIWALADLHLLSGYVFEGNFSPKEYELLPGTGSKINDPFALRDVASKRVSIVFYETECSDGRFRNGELRIMYGPGSNNPDFLDPDAYSDPGFSGALTSAGFQVNCQGIQILYSEANHISDGFSQPPQ